jgi:hypothetical protein
MFIHLSIWISVREHHHHTPGGSDDLPGQIDVLQAKGLDLLPVFRCSYQINLEQQKQVVNQHHQVANCYVGLGFLDVVLTVTALLIELDHFLRGQFRVGDKEKIIVRFTFQKRYPDFLYKLTQFF